MNTAAHCYAYIPHTVLFKISIVYGVVDLQKSWISSFRMWIYKSHEYLVLESQMNICASFYVPFGSACTFSITIEQIWIKLACECKTLVEDFIHHKKIRFLSSNSRQSMHFWREIKNLECGYKTDKQIEIKIGTLLWYLQTMLIWGTWPKDNAK